MFLIDKVAGLLGGGVFEKVKTYAIAILFLVESPRIVRARIRRAHGRCPRCGYPAGQSEKCSECGRRLPRTISRRSNRSA